MLTAVNQLSPLSRVRVHEEPLRIRRESVTAPAVDAFWNDLTSNVALVALVVAVMYLYWR